MQGYAHLGTRGYRVDAILGEGGCGRALKATGADGTTLVIKETLDTDPAEKEAARREADLLMAMHHPFIIRAYDTFEMNGRFYMVCEFADGDPGDLQRKYVQQGRCFTEDEVVPILRMLCSALSHIHRRHVVHRDIKPANVFRMADGSIKLGDFGLAKPLSDTVSVGNTVDCGGTLPFLAPELLDGGAFSWRTDIYACGVMLYWMLSGKLPFQTVGEILKLDCFPLPLPSTVSPGLSGMIMRMLSKSPNDRPKSIQIEAAQFVRPLKIVVWRDPLVRNAENNRRLLKLQAFYAGRVAIIGCETDADALEVIDVSDKSAVWLITNRGQGGPELIQRSRLAGLRTNALVFCRVSTGWMPMDGVIVDTRGVAVEEFINNIVIPGGEIGGPWCGSQPLQQQPPTPAYGALPQVSSAPPAGAVPGATLWQAAPPLQRPQGTMKPGPVTGHKGFQ